MQSDGKSSHCLWQGELKRLVRQFRDWLDHSSLLFGLEEFQDTKRVIRICISKNRQQNGQRNQRLSRACIVHLVIKRTNWSYVKTMSCSGSHLGIPINIKNTNFVKDFPMIDAQFRFNQCNSFREEHISVFSTYGPVLILWPVVAAILDFRSA